MLHSGPQTRGHKAPLCPGLGRHPNPSPELGMGLQGQHDQLSHIFVLKHSEGLISAFNMQIRAWAD